jgi:hypothetical protein
MADLSWTEPESAANTDYQPVYPYNSVTQSESGHSLELDDTPGRERVRLQHGTGNTFIEMQATGDEIHKIFGNGYEIVLKNKNVLISGVCNITVMGDSVLHVQGDSYQQVDGTVYQNVKGNVKQLINGDCEQTVQGDFDINASGDVNISATHLNVNADVAVRGDITATQSVSVKGNISAGLSVSAIKSVETSGFMAAATTIVAGVSVYGPIVSDMFGSMEMFRLKVDRHVHIGNRGFPTSPPSNGMMEA